MSYSPILVGLVLVLIALVFAGLYYYASTRKVSEQVLSKRKILAMVDEEVKLIEKPAKINVVKEGVLGKSPF